MVDVKICGLSTLESVDAAIDAGAALVGLVFYPRSPRHVSLPQAKKLADHARGRAKIVALIVDADDAALQEINNMLRLPICIRPMGRRRRQACWRSAR